MDNAHAIRAGAFACSLLSAAALATEDLQGLRTSLASRGITVEASFTAEVASHLSGRGVGQQDGLGVAEAKVALDGARLAGWRGASGLVHWIRPQGADPSGTAGDLQGLSNIAAEPGGRFLEAWLEQNFLNERISLLAGRYDLNTEFYALRSAALLLNSSYGIGPEFSQTGVGGPSLYPDTAVGGRIEVRPASGLTLRVAALDGAPRRVRQSSGNGALLVGEASFGSRWFAEQSPAREQRRTRRRSGRAAQEERAGDKLAIGAWHYTAQFDHLSRRDINGAPLRHSGSSGGYLVGEKTVYRDASLRRRKASVFAQLGFGDPDVARVGRYLGAGVTLTAPFASRPDDEVGAAFASARNGAPYMDSERLQGRAVEHTETVLEITYLLQISGWLVLQPSLQYVINPGTDPSRPNAGALLVRLEISL